MLCNIDPKPDESRQKRTQSIGLPTKSVLISNVDDKPEIPRRHSAVSMATPPPIPIRKKQKHEQPILILKSERPINSTEMSNLKPAPQPVMNFEVNSSFWAWNQVPIENETFIDSKRSRENSLQDAKNDRTNFLVDFDHIRSEKDSNKGSSSGLAVYEKVIDSQICKNFLNSNDLSGKIPENDVFAQENLVNKRNRANIIKQEYGGNRESSQNRMYSHEELKIDQIQSMIKNRQNAEKQSMFEELQNASKNLEKCLHECTTEIQSSKLKKGRQCEEESPKLKRFPGNSKLQRQSFDAGEQKDGEESEEMAFQKFNDKLEKIPKATQTNLPPPLSAIFQNSNSKPTNPRQDSGISSDSFSQNSSPSYTSKSMETPLLPQRYRIRGKTLLSDSSTPPTSPIIKSISTPASLQAIVKFHSGSNMSIHNRIKDIRRRSSNHYVPNRKLKFRYIQILINAIALVMIAGGLTAYFKIETENDAKSTNVTSYSEMTNKLSAFLETSIIELRNPSPGVCLPVIVNFCQYHKIPYNFTIFPNYLGNFGQREAHHELELYYAVVDIKCYELAALFLCTIFVPKCGNEGYRVPPCRSLCSETLRRCGFFFEVFGLTLPDFLDCHLFPENINPNVCVGHREVIEAEERAVKPGCDTHIDCEDKTDEIGCGHLHSQCLSLSTTCDGVVDCPWGQDERNCLKLSRQNGNSGNGQLQVFHAEINTFLPACITTWDESTSAKAMCSLLGYSDANSSELFFHNLKNSTNLVRKTEIHQNRRSNRPRALLKMFKTCSENKAYKTVELTCSDYACGRRKRSNEFSRVRTRIVGGVEATPGDWPFLAALLGGPEQVFYCAGVLISDQWVLSASHCVGNHSSNVSGWTIQLGITRRISHSYLGRKVKVKRVITHPNYNVGVAHDNDVALFQLEKKVEFHDHLRPVCLPKENEEMKPYVPCTVIGWGKKNNNETSEYEAAVNEVEVPILPRNTCNTWLQYKDVNVTDNMICAGYAKGEKDACQGDSGGPLLCRAKQNDENSRWVVGGITSWGINCAHPRLPGVYTYVPKYVSWIKKEIAKYS